MEFLLCHWRNAITVSEDAMHSKDKYKCIALKFDHNMQTLPKRRDWIDKLFKYFLLLIMMEIF